MEVDQQLSAAEQQSAAGKPFEIRMAEDGDLNAIEQMERGEPLAPHWAREAYASLVGGADDAMARCLLVAHDGVDVIGFLAGSFVKGDEAAELESIVVHAPWRRRKVARALFAGLMEWAKREGAQGLKLEVRATSEGAMRLYTGCGFMECGRRASYYSDPDDDAVLMSLQIPKSVAS